MLNYQTFVGKQNPSRREVLDGSDDILLIAFQLIWRRCDQIRMPPYRYLHGKGPVGDPRQRRSAGNDYHIEHRSAG